MIPGLLDTISGAVKGLFGNDGISGLIDNVTTTKEEKLELQAKVAEIQNKFETNLQQVLLEREKAFLADMADARNREIQIATSEKASWITRNTTALLAVSFVGTTLILYALSILKTVAIHEDILRDLRDIVILIMGYYFGSSMGAKSNGDAIRKIANKP